MASENFEFKSWSEFVEHANWKDGEHEVLSDTGRNPSYRFQHVESYAEAIRLAQAGWREGLEQSQEITTSIERKLMSHVEREEIFYDVTGELLDVGRYCSGEPEHWGKYETTVVQGKGNRMLHLVVSGAASGGIDKSVLIRRGAMVASFATLAELAGYRVKITLNYIAQNGHSSAIYIPLKEYDETLDQDMISFALAHPAALRCLGFSVWDTIKDEKVRNALRHGYGMPGETPKDRQGDIFLKEMTYGAGVRLI